jgi:signal transduction histidine kinase/CheY-like chemotaxis protein/HAMP domain-containing protein
MRLASKFSLAMFLITLGCGVATSAIVSSYLLKNLERDRLNGVDVVVHSLANQLADGVINRDTVAVREILTNFISERRGIDFAYLVTEDGSILAHTFGGRAPESLPRLPPETPVGAGQEFMLTELNGGTYLVGAHALLPGASLGTVHVGINRDLLAAEVWKVAVIILSISLAVAFAGIVAAILVSARFTKPLELLTDSIAAYGSGVSTLPPIVGAGGELGQLSAAFRSMIESRNKAEEALRFQGAMLEAQNAIALDGILIVSPDMKVLYHNRRFLDIWSLPADLESDRDTVYLAKVGDRVADKEGFLARVRHLHDHPDETSMEELTLKDGRTIERYSSPIADTGGNRYGRIWFFRDITERKNSEAERLDLKQQMLHVQKLESLGVLAGGIAHDFNNILTSIVGNAELIELQIPPGNPIMENLRRIEKSAQRATDLARQMLAYSGRGKFVVTTIDLNALVREMAHMLEVSVSKKVAIDLRLGRSLPTMDADATQIRQVVMNLVINASEAIGEESGLITIVTGSRECDREYLRTIWKIDDLEAGSYVFLEVSDNGCGMDRETLTRIFDPFFTTKFTGRGLGMAAVLGIVRGHRGGISVQSEPGAGSTFRILFPASHKAADRPVVDEENTRWRGSGVVLLVDDEKGVREIGSAMLERLGYSVVTADDGAQAVRIFKERNDIALVILDLTMPRMDGVQCLRELRRHDPAARVVMSSGYSEQEVLQRLGEKGFCGILHKPYRLSSLRSVLRNIPPPAAG